MISVYSPRGRNIIYTPCRARNVWVTHPVIVLDAGDRWQLVLQPDHAELSGAFARAWGNEVFSEPHSRGALALAARRHDDGWAVWERWPKVHRVDGEVRPMAYRNVHVRSHLAFYRAAITDVADTDPYAGLLVSMHGAGIYRGRYGTHPELAGIWSSNDYAADIEDFVAEQEATYGVLREALQISETEQWVNYKLLQAFDRLALYFSGLYEVGPDDVHVIPHVPLDYEGAEVELWLTPIALSPPLSPQHVRIDPFPFESSPATFQLARRIMWKKDWSGDAFVQEFRETPPEVIEIRVEA